MKTVTSGRYENAVENISQWMNNVPWQWMTSIMSLKRRTNYDTYVRELSAIKNSDRTRKSSFFLYSMILWSPMVKSAERKAR